jgi:uridine kinase
MCDKEIIFSHQVSEEQMELAKNLRNDLSTWRKFTFGIDGPDGVGKSVLSRFLSWELNMPAIEMDLFINSENEPPSYRYEEFYNVINQRHSLNRPVIVEGIFLLDTLKKVNVECDVLIYVENKEFSGSDQLSGELTEYRNKYNPKNAAKYTFECDFIDQI